MAIHIRSASKADLIEQIRQRIRGVGALEEPLEAYLNPKPSPEREAYEQREAER
jgi:hypothetical protein